MVEIYILTNNFIYIILGDWRSVYMNKEGLSMKKSTHISTFSWSAAMVWIIVRYLYLYIIVLYNYNRLFCRWFITRTLVNILMSISIGNTIYYLLIGKSTFIYLQSLITIMVSNLSVSNLSRCQRPKGGRLGLWKRIL